MYTKKDRISVENSLARIEDMYKNIFDMLSEHESELSREEIRKKLFSMRQTKGQLDKLSKNGKMMAYGRAECINELLLWLNK